LTFPPLLGIFLLHPRVDLEKPERIEEYLTAASPAIPPILHSNQPDTTPDPDLDHSGKGKQ